MLREHCAPSQGLRAAENFGRETQTGAQLIIDAETQFYDRAVAPA